MDKTPLLIIFGLLLVFAGIKISSLVLVTVGIILACLWFMIMDKTDWL